MGRGRRIDVRTVALGAATVALLTGIAHAKPWKKWAPDPLASDSTYGALSALPADSLTAAQLSWLAVQSDWRAQRNLESPSSRSITETWHLHRARRTDERFAALASQPYAALADSERAWLVAENVAQRASLEKASGVQPSQVVWIVLLAALAGAVVAAVVLSNTNTGHLQ